MTGDLDKPLGKINPAEKKTSRFIVSGILTGCLLIVILVGFTYRDLFYTDRPDIPQKQPIRQTVAESQSQVNSEKQSDGIRKRPDLAINKDDPVIQELRISDKPQVPKIIPRKRPENIARKQILAHLPDPELVEKTPIGLLPVKSPDGLRPMDVYARQPDTEGNFGVARIVIIVGGLGISQTSTDQAIQALPSGVTFAFAPYGNSLTRWMQAARKAGHEILMQIPMEPFGYPQINAGNHSLLVDVNEDENLKNLRWSLGRITNYVGVMNYLGGKMLTSSQKLTPVFEELSDRGLMFIDDGSTRNSIAGTLSKTAGLPYTRAHLTIDSVRSRSAIISKLKELEEKAKHTGQAIGVATAFPETISQISKFLKDAKKRGLEITPVSAVIREPKG